LLLVLVMLATWAANDCNLYSSSLGLTAVLPRIKRSHLAIIGGIIGIMMAEFHLAEHMVSFLVLLGIFIAPVAGVYIVSAVDPRDPDCPEKLQAVPHWRLAPLIAWLTGTTVGYLATPQQAMGLGMLQVTTIPTLDAVLAASCCMLMIKGITSFQSRTVAPPAVASAKQLTS
jgi:cytosine permease